MTDRQRTLGVNKVLVGGNLLFFALLLLAGLVVRGRMPKESEDAQAPPSVVATESLPANRLLQTDDLTVIEDPPPKVAKGENASVSEAGADARDKLVGHYLIAPVARGKSVSARMVAERPDLSLNGGAIALGLAVDRKDVTDGKINSGTEVVACSGPSQVGTQSYVVRAVLCPIRGAICVGELLLPPERRGEAALFGPGLSPRLSATGCSKPAP